MTDSSVHKHFFQDITKGQIGKRGPGCCCSSEMTGCACPGARCGRVPRHGEQQCYLVVSNSNLRGKEKNYKTGKIFFDYAFFLKPWARTEWQLHITRFILQAFIFFSSLSICMGWPVYLRCTFSMQQKAVVWWNGSQHGIYCLIPSQVNEISARLGKDFTVTPSKLVQFDPGMK